MLPTAPAAIDVEAVRTLGFQKPHGQCKTRQLDPAAIALVMEHSTQEIVADDETSVTKASGNTLGTYFKKDLSRVLDLTGEEHLRWTVLDEDHALVEIHREDADAEA